MQKLLSIIMPIYNAEKYMRDSIESILNQTYKNIELILIDDGSSDNSLEICNEYRKRDNRIKVKQIQNSGCAIARNVALKMIQGDYISFVDSDDIINKRMCEVLVKNLEENNADISICNFIEFINNIPTLELKELKNELYNNEEAIENLNLKNKFTLALWSKVYRKELFDGEEFPNISSSSDNFIAYKLLYKSNKIVYCDFPFYYYRVNPNSITHKKSNINMNILYEGKKIVEYIKKNIPSQYESTVYKYLFLILGVYNKIINNNIRNCDKQIEEIFAQVNEWSKVVNIKNFMSKKQKIQLNLFLNNKIIYNLICKVNSRFKNIQSN